MCFICEARGDGMVWYKNPRNHSRRMYKMRRPGEKEQEEAPPSEQGGLLEQAIEAKCNGDMETCQQLLKKVDEGYLRGGSTCHVLPLRDCYEMLEVSSPIAIMACICRKRTRALEENEKNYSCLGLGAGMLKWERWPERYRGGVKFVSREEARKWLEYWDKRGMVHMVMNYGGQIGGICNCDYPDCIIIRHRLDYGLKHALVKAEYVAKVDYDLCNGCGDCVKRCQFGAIKFEVTIDRANIDQYQCFGCGVCETGCSRSAISLLDRKSLPGLREVW